MRLFNWLVSTGAGLAFLFTTSCVVRDRDPARHWDRTSAIIQQADQLIAKDKDLQRFHIVVDGFKHDMWLKGRVATQSQRDQAAKLVWAVPGVHSVDNRIEVGP